MTTQIKLTFEGRECTFVATEDAPLKFRSHDYRIDEHGHLQRVIRPVVEMTSQELAERRGRIAAETRATRMQTPKPDSIVVEGDDAPPVKPVASVAIPPEQQRMVVGAPKPPEPSRHDELSKQVAELVREGKSYKQAMDAVLDGAEENEKTSSF